MGRNTSISLGNHFEDFINQEIKSGRYSSVSEVVRSALRLLETEEQKLKDVRSAIVSGEESGFVEDFDSKEFLKMLHKKHTTK
jgi:antitoxin ParD1/3/4